MHAFDRRTYRQTEGQAEFSSLDRVGIPCRAVKINRNYSLTRLITYSDAQYASIKRLMFLALESRDIAGRKKFRGKTQSVREKTF